MAHNDYFIGGEVGLEPADAAVALIVVDGELYLMQLRDQKSGIFYPDHWGLFGGAIDPGEKTEDALYREIFEELGYDIVTVPRYFTEFTFDFSYAGLGKYLRRYYEVQILSSDIKKMSLHEGQSLQAFTAKDILTRPRIVPYDGYAIWMHATRKLIWPDRC